MTDDEHIAESQRLADCTHTDSGGRGGVRGDYAAAARPSFLRSRHRSQCFTAVSS